MLQQPGFYRLGTIFVWAGTKVGRVSKLVQPETVRAEVDARSIAAKPFPYYITMGEVEAFFAQHGQVCPTTFSSRRH